MKIVAAGLVLFCGGGVQGAIYHASTVWGFEDLGDTSATAVSVQGWYFSAAQGTTSQVINGITFTGLNIGSEASGTSGMLSWSGASGYDLAAFDWNMDAADDGPARNAVSVGGIHGASDAAMSLSFSMAAGLKYVIEIVALQPSSATSDRYFDLAVDGSPLIANYYVPHTSPFNNHVIIEGTSDGTINLDFSAGSTGDVNPAISMITVAQVIPEPVSAVWISLAAALGVFIRRRPS